jgi:hypothetical protein
MRIGSDGRVLVGDQQSFEAVKFTVSNNSGYGGISQYGNTSDGSAITGINTFAKGQGVSDVPTNGSWLSFWGVNAWDGAAYNWAASMAFYTDGVPDTGTVPTAILFSTTPPGVDQGPIDRLGIYSDGTVSLLSFDATAAAGPILELYRSSASPVVNDLIGKIVFTGRDSAANEEEYSNIFGVIIDPTSGTEDAEIVFQTKVAGALLERFRVSISGIAISGDVYAVKASENTAIYADSNGGSGRLWGFVSLTDGRLALYDGTAGLNRLTIDPNSTATLTSTDAGAGVSPTLNLYRDSASPAANDFLGEIKFSGRDSAANVQDYALIQGYLTDPTSGTEDSGVLISAMSNGSMGQALAIYLGYTINFGTFDNRGDIIATGNVVGYQTENAQVGTTYTLALADANKMVTLSNGSAITLTVPLNSSIAFPIGTRIDIAQFGAGQVSISSSATIRSEGSKLKLRGQYAVATLWKKGTDEWLLAGDIVA